MIRLLIVDDEELIVEGLVQLFENYDKLELDIYRAYSAIEAMNWLKRTSIDIVMTDIRMPVMSGLDLQREIRRLWPRSRVIFLTGFDDFHYVQDAIRHEAADYILKTEDESTILAAVEKAVGYLQRQFESDLLLEQAKLQMKTALPLLQKEFLWDVLQGQIRLETVIAQQIEELSLSLDGKRPVLLLLGRVDDWGAYAKPSDRMLLVYALQNIMEECLHGSVNTALISYDQSKLVWLVQQKEHTLQEADGSWETTMLFLTSTLELVQSTCKQLLKLPVSFLIGDKPVAWNRCAENFQQLKLMLTSYLGMKQELLMTEKNVAEHFQEAGHDRDAAISVSMSKMVKLETYLETGQKNEFFTLLSEMIKLAGGTSGRAEGEGLRLQLYYSMIAIYFSHMNRSGKVEAIRMQIDISKLTKMESHPGWEEALEFLWRAAEVLFELRHQDEEERDREVIRAIKRYVESNLASDLSLTRIGEITGFNPSYLSRLYKQITGQVLSEYIMEARLNKAKELLKQNPRKIHEIAEALGFESATYFARFFRKMTNVSPSEYREQ
ncbi:response regulator transcription factor [Paenibacillus eucommiae]|uniref:Two-component system response regulator YesN n=1 Tax=Paenibacillus eucommiae TaxID=1355755 RepID=A0ABS4J1Q1_9BACL|nr:response regulator [Paenibacillus eucommiae]MBP1993773.1 two-component system response regulator YesN [Paenibacillus eucommiae]